MVVGIIKEIDKLGRIVIPKDLRDRFGLGERVEIVATEQGLVLRNPEYRLVRMNQEKSQEKNKKNTEVMVRVFLSRRTDDYWSSFFL